MPSVLSDRVDHFGYFYGFAPDDGRQINVRLETRETERGEGYRTGGVGWAAYVGGECIGGGFVTKESAEAVALAWIDENPAPTSDDA